MDTATDTLTTLENLNDEIAQLETACRDDLLAVKMDYDARIKAVRDQIASIVKSEKDALAAAQARVDAAAKLGKAHVPGTIVRGPRRPNRPFTDEDVASVLAAVKDGKSRMADICKAVSDIPEDHVRKALRKLREDGLVFSTGATASMTYGPTGSALSA